MLKCLQKWLSGLEQGFMQGSGDIWSGFNAEQFDAIVG